MVEAPKEKIRGAFSFHQFAEAAYTVLWFNFLISLKYCGGPPPPQQKKKKKPWEDYQGKFCKAAIFFRARCLILEDILYFFLVHGSTGKGFWLHGLVTGHLFTGYRQGILTPWTRNRSFIHWVSRLMHMYINMAYMFNMLMGIKGSRFFLMFYWSKHWSAC
jgi:hypothetical protein